jgi:hypothetical protein
MKGITQHQTEVLKLVAASDVPLDLDQLLPKLSWGPSKEAAQFTIRALVTKGLLLKLPLKLRRGRLRVSYEMTAKGRLVFDPRGPMPIISDQKTAEIEEIPGLPEV